MSGTRLRPVGESDRATLFEWRNLPELIALSASKRSVTWDEHCAWFAALLDRSEHLAFVVEHDGEAVGSVRFDRVETRAHVTIYLLEEHLGQGIGRSAVTAGCAIARHMWPWLEAVDAFVQPENTRSLAMFARAGFVRCDNVDGLERMRWLPTAKDDTAKNDPVDYRSAMVAHYTHLLDEHGMSHRSLDWGSTSSQRQRFKVLAEMADLRDRSVLDVGSGLGDFLAFLGELGIRVDYTGYDITPAMVKRATARFPQARFLVRDIVAQPATDAFDYVVASGIFTFLGEHPVERMQAIIQAMFASARRGIAFNSLSSWAPHCEPGEFFADPLETLRFCRTLTPYVLLRHDYLAHDFSIYLHRRPDPA